MTSPINRNFYQDPLRFPMDEDEREEGEYSPSDLEEEGELVICDWDSDEDSDQEYFCSSPLTAASSPSNYAVTPNYDSMSEQDFDTDFESSSVSSQALLDSIMMPRLCANAIALTELVSEASNAENPKITLNQKFVAFMEEKNQDFLSIRQIDSRVIKALEVSVPGFEFAFSSPSSVFSGQYQTSPYGTCFISKKS